MANKSEIELLGPEVMQEVFKLAKLGVPFGIIADAIGLHKLIFYKWLAKGDKGIEPYASFARDLRKARSEAAIRCLTGIQKAAVTPRGINAAMFYLERQHPSEFGRKLALGDIAEEGEVEIRLSWGGKKADGPAVE